MRVWLVILAALFSVSVYAEIGKVSEHRGSGCNIQREKTEITGEKDAVIHSMDTFITTGCSSNIKFKDDTQVRITENSRLLIDDFVYDPKQSDAGRLAMKVSMGTVRYASGQVAKNNPQRVNIKTPTATVTVRGTDFTMTVDEAGQSLIILLPSCRDNKKVKTYELEENTCVVGKIQVDSNVDSVMLTRAFESTFVSTSTSAPTKPIVLNTIESKISNELILVKPAEIQHLLREKNNLEASINDAYNSSNVEVETTTKIVSVQDLDLDLIKQTQKSNIKNNTSTEIPDGKDCNATTHICVRWDYEQEQPENRGRGVAYRIREGEHYAEIKTEGWSSNTNITVIHNDSVATRTLGDSSMGGNTVFIRQSTGVAR